MYVDLYERIWMWASTALIVVFLGVIFLTAGLGAIHPPSHLETIDPASLENHPEFAEGAVTKQPDGSVVVSVVAAMYAFGPNPIEVPANRPVTFRLTSADVVHGFEVVGTNANAMAIPGYVSEFTVTFPQPGEYVIQCHEYCGVLHHYMAGTLVVTEEAP